MKTVSGEMNALLDEILKEKDPELCRDFQRARVSKCILSVGLRKARDTFEKWRHLPSSTFYATFELMSLPLASWSNPK
jgi:hypothetical protein